MTISTKQKRFALELIVSNYRPETAARRAGYKPQSWSRLLKNAAIQSYIRSIQMRAIACLPRRKKKRAVKE
jgi:phage terminase small subunit